ncbi:uncharacterized protein Dwil_GK11471 [Drosophila willistoni]|uniref:Uncharacterized protein n=1 Tax=Drosophila willistoni TaxID=7260 RepID=B4N9Q2_DROWI|nr:uncharacterized protein Dwil_GK11471 [Drosophila willistoni]
MRRSQAPSVRKLAKRGAQDVRDIVPNQAPRSPPMQWGSSGSSHKSGPRQLKPGENPLEDSRIFHVLWRNPSTRKHKIWTGNGTLVVTGSRATLKDETGKVLGILTRFGPEQIRENEQLEIDLKEVEIQEEITTVEECIEVRNQEISNWCRKIDEENGHLVSPLIDVTRPQKRIMLMRKGAPIPPSIECSSFGLNITDCICVLNPAELQCEIMQILANETSPDVETIQRIVCDHPVLLSNTLDQFPTLKELLLPHLPAWHDMGLYDSGKFEFGHLMLDYIVVERNQKCVLVANTNDCLKLFVGYCLSWDISYIQILEADDADRFNSDDEMMLALITVDSLLTLDPLFLNSKFLILYNYEAREKMDQLLTVKTHTQIFTLITADNVEESEVLQKAIDPKWKLIKPPFSEEFLQMNFLSDKEHLLKSVYIKHNNIKT